MTDQGEERSRIAALLDPGSFAELDRFGAGPGVVSGVGAIDGRDVAVYATESAGEAPAGKIVKLQDLALRTRIPIIALHGRGVRLPAGVLSRVVRSSGVVPQLAVVPESRTAVAALVDFVLAGDGVRALLSYLPSHSGERPPFVGTADPAGRTVPELQPLLTGGLDPREVAGRLLDDGRFLEVGPEAAGQVLTGFGRLAGHAVGVVALTGEPDPAAAAATARFIRCCDAFDVPLVSLLDLPAFGPEPNASKLLYAYAEVTVPHLAVIARRTPPPGLLGADLSLAWPAAEIADTSDPCVAAERGLVDAVIEPRETRRALARGLDLCRRKTVDRPPRKHGNIPL